ncbi:replication protein A 70 kDa DNA-binding subunit A-like [Glycine soja]|uniref:replication protein A 70 kDa DNA-binding subunit A-like n=1 Tax=Glycine soja TaxID=3848 RepID=UPI0003DED46E|nr:replication protein A 70 kDa DNA-binding subunit A-like [Glycine soja]|eukprot:XP_006605163.1 replication protein A 70 kDa DNA-binding subunit A [Glycine max]
MTEINAKKESWRIMVRVVHLWMISNVSTTKQTFSSKIPLSMETVLVDSKTLIYKFDKTLQEGKVYSIQFFGVVDNGGIYRIILHKYKIMFQYSTKVALVDNASVPDSVYDFIPIRDIVCGGYDTDYLVDVMGILTSVGTERENERNAMRTKMNVIEIKDDGFNRECTLFGPFVDELNAFLAFGVVENVVVIVHLAKVKCFQALCCRMLQDMNSPCVSLSQLSNDAVSAEVDFLEVTPKKKIERIKDCKEVIM